MILSRLLSPRKAALKAQQQADADYQTARLAYLDAFTRRDARDIHRATEALVRTNLLRLKLELGR